jgi:hypothetical protein
MASTPPAPEPHRCASFAPDEEAIRFDAYWRTSTVLALAQGIVQDGAFDRMPILADALEDAGCDNAALLRHCRHAENHEPACWVLSLILFHSAVPSLPEPAPPVPTPTPSKLASIARQLVNDGSDFLTLWVLPVGFIAFVAIYVAVLAASCSRLEQRPALPTMKWPDPMTTTFGPPPGAKVALLKDKLTRLLADPNSDPAEVERTGQLLCFWLNWVQHTTSPNAEDVSGREPRQPRTTTRP